MRKRFVNKTQGHRGSSAKSSHIPEPRRAAEIITHWRTRRVPLRKTSAKRVSPKTPTQPATDIVHLTATPKPRTQIAAFKRILVPIDFSTESTRALKFAGILAKLKGGNITLLHVVGPIYDLRGFGYEPVHRRRSKEGLIRHAKQRLRTLGKKHLQANIEWRFMVRSGTGPNQILKEAEEIKASLIVMSTRGLSPAPPLEIGSTAERVVRHSPCPVFILPARKALRSKGTNRRKRERAV